MENTGHYHYPVLKALQEAGLPVCMVNAYQIKKFGDMDLRKAKTDKKDAVRIARYALEKSYSLVPYTSMEQKYEDLRFLARQYNQRMLTLKTNKVFLLNLLDETMPGITNILPLTTRTPETSLSVLFIIVISNLECRSLCMAFLPPSGGVFRLALARSWPGISCRRSCGFQGSRGL